MKNIIKVAIQGVAGAFHDTAAREYFKDAKIEIVPCMTFEDLFALLDKGGCDYGVVAVENSVAGILSHNFFLLNEYSMQIVGEQYLRIVQNLMALPGTTLHDVKEVRSHPIALRQCHLFLSRLRSKGILIAESEDTALSAKAIRDNQLVGVAAVAGELAAKLYGLEIIQEGIESNSRNFTRFLIIKKGAGNLEHAISNMGHNNKASVSFTLRHEPGMLCKVLSIFSKHNLNMTMIQSLPLPGKEWEYKFFADFVFEDKPACQQALDEVVAATGNITLSGLYRRGETSMQPFGQDYDRQR